MAEIFKSVFFRESDKSTESERCFIANTIRETSSTSSGDSISLGEVFIISSFPATSKLGVGDRVDEAGMWDVQCIQSKKNPTVWMVKKALRAHDTISLERNGTYVNIIINGKLGILRENSQEIKLGYCRGGKHTAKEILSFFYTKVGELSLSPNFSVNSFEQEFSEKVANAIKEDPGYNKVLGGNKEVKRKRPRIKN